MIMESRLKLSHTVVDIKGKERLEGITLAQVDGKGKPIPGNGRGNTAVIRCFSPSD